MVREKFTMEEPEINYYRKGERNESKKAKQKAPRAKVKHFGQFTLGIKRGAGKEMAKLRIPVKVEKRTTKKES